MKFYTETSLHDFKAWSGGSYTLEALRDRGLCDQVEAILEELFFDATPSETDINDILWFDRDEIADWLGFKSWEELEGLDESESDG